MRPYTILHTIETAGIGGAENVMLAVASRLDRRRFRSIAVLPEPGMLQDALEAGGVRTHILASQHWWDLRLPRGLSRLARAEGVDLIHSHLPDQNFYSCVAGMIARCKTLVTYHGPLDLRGAASMRGFIKLRVIRSSATSAVAVCEVVKQGLLELGFPSARVAQVYNGIDVDAFRATRSLGIRRQFGWPAETKLVGTVANVRVTKGYEHFVRAARRTVDAHPSVRFVAAGHVDPVLGEPIERLVRELGLQDHVQFLGFQADIPALLHDLDVFVLPSTLEGFPLVLLEAMAAGKAVVATRCGGPEEIIVDGVNGFLTSAGDYSGLSDRILALLTDDARARAFRLRAQETAERFTVESMVEHYEELYKRLLSENGSSRSHSHAS